MSLTPYQAVKKLSIYEHKNKGDGARNAVPSCHLYNYHSATVYITLPPLTLPA